MQKLAISFVTLANLLKHLTVNEIVAVIADAALLAE